MLQVVPHESAIDNGMFSSSCRDEGTTLMSQQLGERMPDVFVVVSGPPASGKSALARAIAVDLALPLIAKDVIKEALMDELGGPKDFEQSQKLGRAAVMSMLAIARLNTSAVLDSVWLPYTIPLLQDLPAPVVEVRCEVSRATATARYQERIPERHPGTLGRTAPEMSCGTAISSSRWVSVR